VCYNRDRKVASTKGFPLSTQGAPTPIKNVFAGKQGGMFT